MKDGEFLGSTEYKKLGFTHCQSSEVLARFWNFSDDRIEAIQNPPNAAAAAINPALVALVALSDRLCRSAELGIVLCRAYRYFADLAARLENPH